MKMSVFTTPKKRVAAALVLLALTGTLLTACESRPPEDASLEGKMVGAMEDFGVGDTFTATEALEFTTTFSDQPAYPYDKEWALFQKMTDTTNVSLDATVIPSSDYLQKRSLLVSSGSAPLIMPKTYPGEESPFVSSGAILPVSDYVEYMPNYEDKVEKWGLEDEIDTLKQEDGKYYVLPGLHEELWPDYTIAIRTDIYEANNIPIPETWDEFAESLRKLKEIYPEQTPFSDRFKGNSILNIAAASFGTSAGWGYADGLAYDEGADEFSYTAASDEYREMVGYFQGLVADGLMDPESFTQDDDTAIQKFVTGESFAISTNSQTLVSDRATMNELLGESTFSIAKIRVPSGPAGDVIAGSRLENGIMLSAGAAKSENFVALLQFVDWLFYSNEGEEFAKWGVEGETFTKDVDGTRTLTPEFNYNGLNPSGTKDLRIAAGYSGGNFAYGGTTELLQSMMLPEEIEWQLEMESKEQESVAPPILFSEIEREQVTLLTTPLKDYVDQMTLKFIVGQRDLSEYDTFITELEDKGLTKYVDLANKTYKK